MITADDLLAGVFRTLPQLAAIVLTLAWCGGVRARDPDYQYLFAKAVTLGLPEVPERFAAFRAALGQRVESK